MTVCTYSNVMAAQILRALSAWGKEYSVPSAMASTFLKPLMTRCGTATYVHR